MSFRAELKPSAVQRVALTSGVCVCASAQIKRRSALTQTLSVSQSWSGKQPARQAGSPSVRQ